MRLRIAPALLGAIERHCQGAYPREAAGLLFGTDEGQIRSVTEIKPLENAFEESEQGHRYLIDPREMMEADEQADRMGTAIIGVFHSHPDHPALPSEFDRRNAWPWLIYTITSVREGQPAGTRAWLLDDNRRQFDEIELVHDEVPQEKN